MLRLAETAGVSEPVFAPVLAAHGRLGAPPGGAGPRWLCSAEFGRPGPLEASGCSEAAPSSISAPLQPITPPPMEEPRPLLEVGGGVCVPGHCPAPQVCFGHSCQVRTRRREPVWGQPPPHPHPPPSGKHPQQLFFSSFNFVNGPKDPICRPRLSLTGKSWVL